MKSRTTFLIASAAAAVALGAVAPSMASAAPAESRAVQKHAVPQRLKARTIDLSKSPIQPAALRKDRTITATVLLDAPTVVERERSSGRSFTKAQARAARHRVEAGQAAVKAAVRQRGGTVVRDMQDAVNGLTVRIKAGEVDALARTAGVARVVPAHTVHLSNTSSDLFTGAVDAWTATPAGLTGQGVKIGIIDTGIDYYHLDLGGTSVDAAAAAAAFTADDSTLIEPGSFPTVKVAGGTDLVGDDYDPDSAIEADTVPKPDPDPLDCNGHGTHVAGTAAGTGILSDGSVYSGPYNRGALEGNAAASFRIGPGSAPEATLYAYRVFGCDGGATDADVAAAIDKAVADGVDVISMSLGAAYGGTTGVDVVASNAAASAGVIVVAASGNDGASPFMTSAPGSASRVISVAAVDGSRPTFPGATLATATPAASATLINANDADLTGLSGKTVKVLTDTQGNIALGCEAADYSGVGGMIVVTARGICARSDRATLGQAAGAVAVVMVNSGPGLPPFEGKIPGVTIPFLGADIADADTLDAMEGNTTASVTAAGDIPNAGYKAIASFSSAGPRTGDNAPKPDVAAPGVSVTSANVGTGNDAVTESGTSMATPHVAGIAALVRQNHATWPVDRVKAALTDTATAASTTVVGYDPLLFGSGLVQPRKAVDSSVHVLAGTSGRGNLAFGFDALGGAYSETKTLTLVNTGTSAVKYAFARSGTGSQLGETFTVTPSTVVVPKRTSATVPGTATLKVTIALTAARVKALPDALQSDPSLVNGVRGVLRGTVVGTPKTGQYSLRVPYVSVPRGVSKIGASTPTLSATGKGSTTVTNTGVHRGTAELFALGASETTKGSGSSTDLRSVGVNTFTDATVRWLQFAVGTHGRWSNPAQNAIDVLVDTNADGLEDFDVFAADFGLVTSGAADGQMATFIFDIAANDFVKDASGNMVIWATNAPHDSTTAILTMQAADLGMAGATTPNFRYYVTDVSIPDESDPGDQMPNPAIGGAPRYSATFNAAKPPQSNGDFAQLPPNTFAKFPLKVNSGPKKPKWIVVSPDDTTGAAQSSIVTPA